MTDQPFAEKDPVPEPHLHPPQWTLDLFAEGALPESEQAEVASHIAACRRCEAETEVCRVVINALGALPRLEPTPAFADAVMARVRIGPETGAIRVRQWLPQTRRGWTLFGGGAFALSAPAMIVFAWILSQPLVTMGGLWFWSIQQLREILWTGASRIANSALELGAASTLTDLVHAFAGVPGGTVAMLAASLAVLVPVSAWSLVRLARTSTKDISHAY